MNDLVEKLAQKKYAVEASRPKKTINAFKECLERDYVHIMFKETQTELGIQLDRNKCNFAGCNLEKGQGTIHLEGGVILNYDRVRVVVDLELETLNGEGQLFPINEEEYDSFMKC